ncbi:hypothetical protein PAXRUDRAFT_157292 [Paxillus rubicundulus Ve08.2h10]|uniref:Uncharacterized protein n=1 Tax=Paxillus rubicundulus Ve08.2h10 TaxID=930991 RepID=A0A0D0DHN1_9AGAM|nr:hypothetical protein PAXRUDRAFT_157292 [Paxillus rubicundulus Ve08.2h10]
MENPHHSIQPDFTSDTHAEACLQLADRGIVEDLITPTLQALWTLSNDQAKQHWDARLEQEAQEAHEAQRAAAEEEKLRQRALEEEQDLTKQEEQKKNKIKFIPVPDISVPTESIVIPSSYTLTKLHKAEYCELYYFTNRGLADAETTTPSFDDKALVLTKSDNGIHSFVSLSSVKAKSSLIKDEDLTWEEFGQAKFRMINTMCESEWPDEHIQMHIDFWLSIETHEWRHDTSLYNRSSLLTYEAHVRELWHRMLGTPKVFSLAKFNNNLLKKIRDELVHKASTAQIAAMQQVCFFHYPVLSLTFHVSHLSFSLFSILSPSLPSIQHHAQTRIIPFGSFSKRGHLNFHLA